MGGKGSGLRDPGDRTQTRQELNAKRNRRKYFVGIDGEGGYNGKRHIYNYLAAASDTFQKTLVSDSPNGLSTKECLEFLSSLPPTNLYASFSFTYDVTMMLRDCERSTLMYLWDRDERQGEHAAIPVAIGAYQVDWLPGKMFKIRKGKGKWVTIWDAFGFFQTSFVKSLESWQVATDTEAEFVERMKLERSNFMMYATKEVQDYCILECKLLGRMMDKLRSSAEDIGIFLKSYQGAGSIGSSLLEKNRVRIYRGTQPIEVMEAAAYGYYGGRFETSVLGHVKEPVYSYDINSAYPWAATICECLECGRWVYGDTYDSRSAHNLVHVRWDIPDIDWGPFPVRTRVGEIIYPTSGEGWYYIDEVRVALQYVPDGIDVLEAWNYIPDCDHNPFAWVPEVYAQRQTLKKEGRWSQQQVMKMGLNSVYGKLAQGVGSGRYRSLVWAGTITSLTRSKLLDIIRRVPTSVVMCATDGIFTTVKLEDIVLGDSLGDWEAGVYPDGMFVAQSGVYFTPSPEGWDAKTRGISRKEFDPDKVMSVWYKEGINGTIPLKTTRFIGIGTSLILTDGDNKRGQWVTQSRTFTFDPLPKRDYDPGAGYSPGMASVKTYPVGGIETISYPYERTPEIEAYWREQNANHLLESEQPI